MEAGGGEGVAVAQTKVQEEEDKRENYKTLLSFNEIISRERFLDAKKSSSRDVTLQPKGHTKPPLTGSPNCSRYKNNSVQ